MINEDIKQNNKKLNNLLTEQKNIINNTNNKLDIIDNIIDNSYDNYNIELKEPFHKLNYHTGPISCSTVLKDGRFVTGSNDKSIIIYNNKTFKPDKIIKEHYGNVNYILKLNSGLLASCSNDGTIKIYNIKNNNYEVVQTLKYNANCISKIIELNNDKLACCSNEYSIIIYSKDKNDKYIKDYIIFSRSTCIIQTKENEICFNDENKKQLYFYDLIEKKIINEICNIIIYGKNCFNMITKDLLLVTEYKQLYIINVDQYNLVRIINVPDSYYIHISCLINKNIVLTGDMNGNIKQWKIEGDNLKFISTKEKAHDYSIRSLIKLGGHIISGSDDGIIKIW